MSKILQLSAGIIGTLLLCTPSNAVDLQSNNNFWTPTSTLASPSKSINSILPSLRLHDSNQRLNVPIERAVRLEPEHGEISENNSLILTLVNEGELLLQKQQWSDAKKFFEKALRSYPNNETLRLRFAEARRRLEIEKRYQDSSFSTLTKASSLEDQLIVFDEVLFDIDVYHVDRPRYAELFNLGLLGIKEALSEEDFYVQNGLSVEIKGQAEALLQTLCQMASSWTIESCDDIKRSVLWLAKQMRRRVGIQESVIISEFLCSTVCSLDAYSTTLTPLEVDDVFSLIDGKFVGLGVELKSDQPTIIVRVIPNSPAEKGGLLVGDELIKIDERPTQNLTGTEIGELLQGCEGEKATLVLRSPNGQLRKVVVTRRPIEVPSIEDVRVLDVPGSIGYLKISCFQKTTSDELKNALEKLSNEQIKSLIIDLRENPGGLLQEAINVSDYFLDSGTIVQTRGRNGNHVFSARKKQVCSLPLVIIVNSNSASAAEIFAGAIQENNRGVVVGAQSYGKGTVQAIVQLNNATQGTKPIAGVRLTTEKFYSPKGRAYGGVGVLPNVEIPQKLMGAQIRSNVHGAYTAKVTEISNKEEHLNVHTVAKQTIESNEDLFIKVAIQEANKQTAHLRRSEGYSQTSQTTSKFLKIINN